MTQKEMPVPKPVCVEVRKGCTYFWCGCGLSDTLPFCDKQDKCGDQAVQYQALFDDTVFFCNCRQTQEPPLCDGSHAALLIELAKKKQKNQSN